MSQPMTLSILFKRKKKDKTSLVRPRIGARLHQYTLYGNADDSVSAKIQQSIGVDESTRLFGFAGTFNFSLELLTVEDAKKRLAREHAMNLIVFTRDCDDEEDE